MPSLCCRAVIGCCLLAAAAALSSGCDAAPPAGYHVRDGFVRDPQGRAMVLRGMNLSGMHKLPPYFDFQQVPDYQRVRAQWGMNAVRFLISWAAVEPSPGAYDQAYLDALSQRMEWAREAGLLVILDMHQDVYGEGFARGGGNGAPRWTCDEARYAAFVPDPQQWFLNYLSPEVVACYDGFYRSAELRARYAAAWGQVARRLASYGDVILGFDPMNEPYNGNYPISRFEAEQLQPLYRDVIAAVRATCPGWIAFVEPAASRNLGFPTGLRPFDEANIVYAPHSYDHGAESGQGFDPTHRAAVMADVANLAGEAQALGAALWIGEYGGMSASPGITAYMDAEYSAFGAVAAGSAYWDYSRGGAYAVLAADGSEKAELLAALLRPYPERVAGTPESWAYDAAARTFTLRYRPDGRAQAPTVISVPGRAYPRGYVVDCGGCAARPGLGEVEIDRAPQGEVAVVTLRPAG